MNYCTNCGSKVEDYYNVCPQCGTVLKNDSYVSADSQYKRTNTYSSRFKGSNEQNNTSNDESNVDVFAILGFILAFFIPIIGLIFSIIGLKSTKNKGFAVAGVVINSIIVFFTILVLVFYIIVMGNIIGIFL